MNEQTIHGATAPAMNFALGFQPDGVQLLRRSGGAWAELDRAPFSGDLRGALGGFVQRLRAANTPGLALVIPEDQILYTDLVLPQAGSTDAALRAGLDGLTPYRVEDLAFDYAPADAAPGTSVKVAAVARQTLQEAEDFAVRHGFAPDRFLAAPQPDQFPHAPDFGATDLAVEWARAAELAADIVPAVAVVPEVVVPDAVVREAVVPTPAPAATAPESSAPIFSRITPHLLIAAAPVVAAPEATASVNLGSIVLPGEETATADAAKTPTQTEAPAHDAAPDEVTERPGKVLPDRARAFHDRAQAARQMRPALAAPARSQPAPGRRSGLSGALPMVGLLVLGLGIAAAISSRDPAPEPTPQVTEATPAVTPAPTQAPVAAAPMTSTPAQPAQVATAPVAPVPAQPAPAAAEPVAAPANVAAAPEATPAPTSVQPTASAVQATASATPQPVVAPVIAPVTAPVVAPVAPPAAAISAASDLLRASPAPAVAEAPAPQAPTNTAAAAPEQTRAAETTAPAAAPATSRPAVAASARPKSRPADLTRTRAAAPAEPARSTPSATAATTASRSPAPAARPASRPQAEAPKPAASRSPGAPDSATLRSSARPKTAPSRSTPARASAAPDARPAVPRSPQPYERRAQPEPTGSRPPPKPAASSNQGAALHVQPAPVRLTMFTQAGRNAMLARLDQPWVAAPAEAALPLIRTAQARPSKKPTRTDAVDDAVAAALGGDRPASRASTSEVPVVLPRRSSTAPALQNSNRPHRRPSGLATASGSGSASTSGLSAATNAAVEEAIASAVSSSAAVPGRVALTALTSSARPLRRSNNASAAEAPQSGVAAITEQEGTLAPVPEADGTSKAAAEAAALAERRRLDDELQRQAEQRARSRASADAQAAAQAKAAAEARARAQAEAEAAAAARKNQRYRPPEVDNEPEVAAAPSGPTSTSVAGAATNRGIDMNATQLIGTVGAGKASRGLIRLRNGKIVTVRLGDKINGGQITQIGNGGLLYVKAGKQYSLPILNGR